MAEIIDLYIIYLIGGAAARAGLHAGDKIIKVSYVLLFLLIIKLFIVNIP